MITRAIVLIILTGCSIQCMSPDPLAKERYVPGEVLIGLHAPTLTTEAFKLVNGHALFIKKMTGFFHHAALPNDSLDYVIGILKNKPYLNKNGFKGGSAFIHAVSDKITVTETFFDMDQDAQSDWLSTMGQLRLNDLEGDTKMIVLIVEAGTEFYWLETLKTDERVAWADLNWFQPITNR